MNAHKIPTHWNACSRADLEQLAAHGTYGQRIIARRYILALTAFDLPSAHVRPHQSKRK